jgi:hypothetical protein
MDGSWIVVAAAVVVVFLLIDKLLWDSFLTAWSTDTSSVPGTILRLVVYGVLIIILWQLIP